MSRFLLIIAAVVIVAAGCKKGAGEGGSSSITGKVTLLDYNGAFPFYCDTMPAQEKDVYIIYGDETSGFDNRVRTSYDGTFRFDYLRKGDYRIFVYTDDTVNIFSQEQAVVLKEVTISKNRSTVEVPEITVIKL